jgi:nucleoside-diphosphate-sugar epimerase
MASPGETLVLVTGVSGSIAGAVAKALLAAGYRVRGTVRDVNNQASVCTCTCGQRPCE